jgi:hypothetical protein
MGETKNSFLQGKLQLDLDERIVPNGEYRNAENVRVSTSLNSNVGSANNVLGNEQLTFNGLVDATVIGSAKDESDGFIYYFVTSPTIDAVYEYDVVNQISTPVLLDTAGRVLKFNTSFRITGSDFIVGNKVIQKQLSWTDFLNPPRKIYIDTAKALPLDGFDDNDISVVKRPPFEEPSVVLVRDYSITSNDITGNYFMFGYRYIYEGEEISAVSFFSESLVSDTIGDNLVVDPNVIDVTVDTGDSRVLGFEIVVYQPQSSNYTLIDSVIKNDKGLGDNVDYTYRFTNGDIYRVLSEVETLKIFDNVPLVSKDQNFVGNRLMYLNYRDGYDMVNSSGDNIPLDYSVQPVFETGYSNVNITSSNPSANQERYDYSAEVVLRNNRLSFFSIVLFGTDQYQVFGSYYVKTEGIGTIGALMASPESSDIVDFIEEMYKSQATNLITFNVFTSFDVTVSTINSTTLVIQLDTVGATYGVTLGAMSITNSPTTFLSDNSQEFGLVYYDAYNRSGSVQYVDEGKVYFSDLRTRVDNAEGQKGVGRVTITHEPPFWASKYKVVRRDNNYIFNKFFVGAIYEWSIEPLYYLSIAQNSDKNKITVGETITSQRDKNLRFRVEEIVEDLPTGGISTGVSKEFGLYRCTLLFGQTALGPSVPVVPNPSEGTIVRYSGSYFNTSENNDSNDIYYECSGTYSVINGLHEGNVQNQTLGTPAITDVVEGDAYIWVNADVNLERFKYNDDLVGSKFESVNKIRGNLVSSFSRERNRIASITYSDLYISDTAYNGLNSFNLSQGNFKGLPERDGSIQRSHSRQGSLVVFQTSQVSQVLLDRDAYFNSEADINVTTSDNVLGAQIHYTGEYGMSLDPDSFAFWGNDLYYTDADRGVVLRLGLDGQTEVSIYGMRGFFKNLMRDNIDALKIGGYDPVNDEYILSVGNTTLSFNEASNSWTSFHSFVPEDSINIKGQFYTFKNGDLYIHNSKNVNRSTFYGISYPSKLSIVVNAEPSGVKIFQNIQLEGNNPWGVVIRAYKSDSEDFSQSTILDTEFKEQEGMWYSYIRRNELSSDTSSKATYGLGKVSDITALDVTVGGGNSSLSVGDDLYKGSTETLIGTITAVNGNVLSLTSVAGLLLSDFVYGVKDSRIEGAEIRGYVARIDLEKSLDTKLELFSVDTFGVESNP